MNSSTSSLDAIFQSALKTALMTNANIYHDLFNSSIEIIGDTVYIKCDKPIIAEKLAKQSNLIASKAYTISSDANLGIKKMWIGSYGVAATLFNIEVSKLRNF